MKKLIYAILASLLVIVPAVKAAQTAQTRMLIPLYIFPTTAAYAPVVNANGAGNIDVILNPANGVGASRSTAYVNAMTQLKAGNVGVYGYVYTSYSARAAAAVKSEIDNWQLWYGVDGIFLDEAANTSVAVGYYTDLYNYIHAKGMKVIINPSANTLEAYAGISDSIVVYENTPSASLAVPTWSGNYPSSQFGALQYAASVDQMRAFVANAKAKNVGYVFITSDILPNPWDTLPSYLAEEAALLAGGVAQPTNTASPLPNITLTSTQVAGQVTRFAVIGDYGSHDANELGVANLVKSWNPDFIITTGDNNYESGAASTIDINIGQYYHDYIGNYHGAYGAGSVENRFFPSLGNHDHVAANAQPYIDYFTLPGNEYYYDYVRGDIHFFVLDHYMFGGTSQTGETALWLKAGLAASTSRWNIVYFHAAPYTSGIGNSSYLPMRWPFAAWGADVVMAGHEHSYERLTEDGITYFVNGAGGRALYGMGAPIAGSQVRWNSEQGAMLVESQNGSISFMFITKSGRIVDNYTLGTPITSTPVTSVPTSTFTTIPPSATASQTPVPTTVTPSQTVLPPSATLTPTVPTGTAVCVPALDVWVCNRDPR